ncbi:hypothetical protein HK097_004723 [Rhizophlyctis rosea]|uniref:G-protein coupled receptors family 3 profile domain-containing protein n=1 Tax=Rhizophlyctis rosea TaxID=64517 RepID=A0AAD5SDW5_9FUNG|nr:hypothetical protein HK097_004723 [Rhizophlyctis rosea]
MRILAVRLLFALVALVELVATQRNAMTIGNGLDWGDWSTNGAGEVERRAAVDIPRPGPYSFLQPYEYDAYRYKGIGFSMSGAGKVAWRAWNGNNPYSQWVFFIKTPIATQPTLNEESIYVMMFSAANRTYSKGHTQLKAVYDATLTQAFGDWTRYVVPLEKLANEYKQFYPTFDTFEMQHTIANVKLTIDYAGFIGTYDAYSVAPPPPPVTTIDQPFTYLTEGKSQKGVDTKEVIQWVCSINAPAMSYPDLTGVMISGWRDTNISIPMAMTMTDAVYANELWNIQDMDRGPTTLDAYSYPHPAYACAMHNADYMEIGNAEIVGPDNLIVFWAPEQRADAAHLTAALASYVKATRDENGTDTVAFHIRYRPDPFYGIEYDWVQILGVDCSDEYVKGPNYRTLRHRCPDVIFFKDEQMGWLKTGQNMLLSMNSLEREYFKKNGFLASLSILPLLQKYTVYSEENYAIPYALYFDAWLINKNTVNNVIKMPMPPDGTTAGTNQWGSAWWETWNIKKLNEYIDAMYAKGINNIFPLTTGGETKWSTFLGFPYGASVLNSTGRCGLDESMEQALTETIVYWKSKSNWVNGIDSQKYSKSNDPAMQHIPGVLPWRGTYPSYGPNAEDFEVWRAREPLEDPSKEPIFSWKDTFNMDPPNQVRTFEGFAFDYGYGAGGTYTRIYPPTGAGYMGAKLMGIARSTRNSTRTYEILMAAFARNKRFQVNCPNMGLNNVGGVSGYLGIKDIAEFKQQGKSFYDGMIDHSIAVGTPAAQSMSYGRIAIKNPMQVAWNDILYKDKPVADSLARACKIINANTKPPCTASDLEPFLEDDIKSNAATLKFEWKADRGCNENLPNSAKKPVPLAAAVPTVFVSTESGIAKAMTALAGACMVIIFLIILMFFHKRDSPPIRAASRLFSNLILLGGEVTLASVILRTSVQGKLEWPQCFGTYWFFALGFGLVMGSLFVKTYRVDRIFRNKKMGFSLPDIQLFGYVLFIELVEIAFLLVLQFKLDDPSYERKITIPLTDYAVTQKSCPVSSQVGPILLYVWNAFIILMAAVYAMRTRKVQSAYNENIFTVAAIALISVISIVIVPVLTIIESPNAIFLMVSLGTIVGTTLSVLVFAIPKLMLAYEIVSFKQALNAVTTRAAQMTTSSGDESSGTKKRGTQSSAGTGKPSTAVRSGGGVLKSAGGSESNA